MLTKCLEHFCRTKAIRLPCHRARRIGQRTSSRYSSSGRMTDTSRKPRSRERKAAPVDHWPNPRWARNGYPTAIAGIKYATARRQIRNFFVHVLLSHFALDDVDLGIRLGLERFNVCNAIRAQLASPGFSPSPRSKSTTARAGNLTGTLTQPVFNESARC